MIRALRRVRSVTARRQLRWIVWGTALGSVPFVFGYALPFALGLQPLRGFEFTALLLGLIPLAFASAIVRYRLMDVEVIIKRGAGLRGGARGDRGDLRDPPADWRARSSCKDADQRRTRSSRCWRRSSSSCCRGR